MARVLGPHLADVGDRAGSGFALLASGSAAADPNEDLVGRAVDNKHVPTAIQYIKMKIR